MIILQCNCGAMLKVKPENAGKPVRCPNCKEVTVAPSGASASTPLPPADAPSVASDPALVNMPRLRSEALRAAAPVTQAHAATAFDSPGVKTVAATAPRVVPTSVPAPPSTRSDDPTSPASPLSPQPPLAPPSKPPRRAPPLPPPAMPPASPLPSELSPSSMATTHDRFSAVATNTSAIVTPPPSLPQPQIAAPSSWPLSWRIGAGLTALCLLLVAILVSRGGTTDEPPQKQPVAAANTRTALESESNQAEAKHDAADADSPPEQERNPIRPNPQPRPAVSSPPQAAPVVSATPAQSPGEPGQIVKVAPPAPRIASPPRGPGGLTGVSRQYDDLDCMRLQAQHAVRVPAAATMLEVNGQRLPLTNLQVLTTCPAPYLFLPRGTHAVKFRKNETPLLITIQSDLSQVYHEMRAFFDAGGNVREVELISRGAKALDVHSAPFLLNVMGAVHLNKKQPEAAERTFRRALRVNPLFAPAHLNLAAFLAEKGATVEARTELELAEATNVGNCFGLSPAIVEVRRQLMLAPAGGATMEIELDGYQTQESLSEEDRRLTALMQSLAKYAVHDADRGKILNNLAVHFAESGRTELALDHFRSALGVLKSAGPERFKLAQQVLTHMSQACRTAKYDEAEDYDRMRSLVTP